MKISIITICYNSEQSIESTLQSVANQSYDNIEYIIVDGGSTDETMQIVSNYKEIVSKSISEPDDGLYDAINKGILMATGDYIGLIHSDDFFAYNDAVQDIADKIVENPEIDAVYGDLIYVDQFDVSKTFRMWKSGSYKSGMFLKGWMPPHPTFYAKRELFETYGNYRVDFRFAADYELMLRFIHKYKIRLEYIEKVIVKMRIGGKSNVSVKNRITANREDRRAWKVNGLKPGVLTLTFKPLSKVLQYLGK